MLKSIATVRSEGTAKQESKASYNTDYLQEKIKTQTEKNKYS